MLRSIAVLLAALMLPLPVAAQAGPEVAARSVCRPSFTVDGKAFAAGTAFALAPRDPGRPPLLVTAIHLIGPAGGFRQDVPWNQMALRARLTRCGPLVREAEPDGDPDWRGGAALTVPGARPAEGMPYRDVAAFPLETGVPVLELAPLPPRPGDTVWLVSGAVPLRPLQKATVTYAGVEALQYVFDDPSNDLRAASGAPVVDEQGRVVGVHLGTMREKGQMLGAATGLQILGPALNNAR